LADSSLAVDVFAVLNSENQNALVYDHKDDTIVTNAELAHAGERATESGEALRMADEFRVDLLKKALCIGFANALQILPNGLLVVDTIVQGMPSYLG